LILIKNIKDLNHNPKMSTIANSNTKLFVERVNIEEYNLKTLTSDDIASIVNYIIIKNYNFKNMGIENQSSTEYEYDTNLFPYVFEYIDKLKFILTLIQESINQSEDKFNIVFYSKDDVINEMVYRSGNMTLEQLSPKVGERVSEQENTPSEVNKQNLSIKNTEIQFVKENNETLKRVVTNLIYEDFRILFENLCEVLSIMWTKNTNMDDPPDNTESSGILSNMFSCTKRTSGSALKGKKSYQFKYHYEIQVSR
jgi:hypothetical protein